MARQPFGIEGLDGAGLGPGTGELAIGAWAPPADQGDAPRPAAGDLAGVPGPGLLAGDLLGDAEDWWHSRRGIDDSTDAIGYGPEIGRALGIDGLRAFPLPGDDLAAAKGGNGGGKPGGNDGDPDALPSYATPDRDTEAFFNVEIVFKGSWTRAAQEAFVKAVGVVETIIEGDVQDVYVYGLGKPRAVDDIQITAELKAIDDVGGILGQAGPTAIRTADSLPATAIMQFDSADSSALLGQGLWDTVVLHEMFHCLGFGSLWDRFVQDGQPIVEGLGTANPRYVGDNAYDAYVAMLGGAADPAGIPIEESGGSGTAGSHWDEETFGDELMTGYLNGTPGQLSAMTVAAFADFGYVLGSGAFGVVSPDALIA